MKQVSTVPVASTRDNSELSRILHQASERVKYSSSDRPTSSTLGSVIHYHCLSCNNPFLLLRLGEYPHTVYCTHCGSIDNKTDNTVVG